MYGFPKTTEFNKRIPKQKFYENMELTPSLKRCLVDQIKLIYWRNKLATATLNVAAGDVVTEIEVFEIRLQEQKIDEDILRQIDKVIPYHILFLLTCGGKEQAWIGYKEGATSGSNTFKVSRYYHTEWMPEGNLKFAIDGLNLDAIYAGLVHQIAGDSLSHTQSETLREAVERDEAKQQLLKQISSLKTKIRKEKQLNRRMELNTELKKLRIKMESLFGGGE